jgi:hypothetical protein
MNVKFAEKMSVMTFLESLAISFVREESSRLRACGMLIAGFTCSSQWDPPAHVIQSPTLHSTSSLSSNGIFLRFRSAFELESPSFGIFHNPFGIIK